MRIGQPVGKRGKSSAGGRAGGGNGERGGRRLNSQKQSKRGGTSSPLAKVVDHVEDGDGDGNDIEGDGVDSGVIVGGGGWIGKPKSPNQSSQSNQPNQQSNPFGVRCAPWKFVEHGPNIHELEIDLQSRSGEFRILLVSDMHWDNPHCDRKLLAKHLGQAVACGAPILSVGDLYCAMQGKYDRRSDKSCVLPEHQHGDYLDRLVSTGVDWFSQYGKNLVLTANGNHECLDPSTEVLTTCGWKAIPEISADDLVCSMEQTERNLVFRKPTKVHAYDYAGEMVQVASRDIDMLMTPNHRVCYIDADNGVLAYKPAGEKVFAHQRTSIPVCGNFNNQELPWISDDEIRFAAWMLTDGSVKNRWQIYQSKPVMIEKIEALLGTLGVKYRKRVRDRDIKSICGVALKSRALPSCEFHLSGAKEQFSHLNLESREHAPAWCWKINRRQFGLFLDSMLDANGSRHKSCSSSRMLYGSKSFLNDIQSLCVMNGYRAMLSERKRKKKHGTNKSYFCLNITERSTASILGSNITRVPYEGKVYCLTTETGNFVARRNGKVFVTGNSAIQNHHETNLTDRLSAGLRAKGGITRSGGYGGWLRLRFTRHGRSANSIRLYYHHGFGGGGPVTMGKIDFNRYNQYADADVIVAGHVHYKEVFPVVQAQLTDQNTVRHRTKYMIRCGTYKDEFGTGAGGYHVEKGRGPRPMGGYWLRVKLVGDELAMQVDEAGAF